jgi:cell shape-determining protein MreD
MNRYAIALILVFLSFAWAEIFRLPWTVMDPLLGVVVLYTFFHSLDGRAVVFFAIFCGFLREFFSLDVFGVYVASFALAAYGVSWFCRLVFRENWIFLLPAVFLGVVLNNAILLLLTSLGLGAGAFGEWARVAGRISVQASGTVLFVFALYRYCRPCVYDFIE